MVSRLKSLNTIMTFKMNRDSFQTGNQSIIMNYIDGGGRYEWYWAVSLWGCNI
jgi:hypothetical protein